MCIDLHSLIRAFIDIDKCIDKWRYCCQRTSYLYLAYLSIISPLRANPTIICSRFPRSIVYHIVSSRICAFIMSLMKCLVYRTSDSNIQFSAIYLESSKCWRNFLLAEFFLYCAYSVFFFLQIVKERNMKIYLTLLPYLTFTSGTFFVRYQQEEKYCKITSSYLSSFDCHHVLTQPMQN